jgi:hypothetical protein
VLSSSSYWLSLIIFIFNLNFVALPCLESGATSNQNKLTHMYSTNRKVSKSSRTLLEWGLQ